MGIEYELKYKATPEALDRLEAAYPGKGQRLHMESTYFDTPDGALSARFWTLRRRMENKKSICTFKFPVKGMGRGEFEVECSSIEDAIPKLCKLSGMEELALLTQAGLTQVCGARFTRLAIPVTSGKSILELALDRGVLTGGGQEIPLFEVEAELKSGDPKDADLFGAWLQATFGLEPESRSKFRRALCLAKGE